MIPFSLGDKEYYHCTSENSCLTAGGVAQCQTGEWQVFTKFSISKRLTTFIFIFLQEISWKDEAPRLVIFTEINSGFL